MTNNRVDQQLQRFSSAVAHLSPDPRPLDRPVGAENAKRPLLAVTAGFAVVLVVVGATSLGLFLNRGNDSVSGTEVQSDFDAYWAWVTDGAVPLEEGFIGVTQTGPIPTFDLSGFDQMQRIVLEAEVAASDLSFSAINVTPPVAYVGTIHGTRFQVLLSRPTAAIDGDMALCVQNREPDRNYGSCTGDFDLAEGHLLWLLQGDEPGSSEPTGVVSVAMLPRDTALAVLTLADGWTIAQRPVGGVAAFGRLTVGDYFTGSLEALNADGTVIAELGF